MDLMRLLLEERAEEWEFGVRVGFMDGRSGEGLCKGLRRYGVKMRRLRVVEVEWVW